MNIEVNIKNNHVRAIIFTIIIIFSISFVFAPTPSGQYHTSDELYITKNLSMNNYNLTDIGAIKFPDGSVQTSAASTGGSENSCIDVDIPIGSTGESICTNYYMTCTNVFSSSDPISISDFGISQLISDNLPASAEGYACAHCYSYTCPIGYNLQSCSYVGIGGAGCCDSCSISKIKCIKDYSYVPPTYSCTDSTTTEAVVKCCS